MKPESTVHVLYAGWLLVSCSILARIHDVKKVLLSIQVFCCKIFTMLWYDTSYRRLCVQSPISKTTEALWPRHGLGTRLLFEILKAIIIITFTLGPLSHRRLSVLICLKALVSFSSLAYFGTLFSASSLRIASLALLLNVMTSLIIYFPCLAALFFPLEHCLMCPLAPVLPTFGSEIASLDLPECWLLYSLLLLHALSLWPRTLLFPLQFSFAVSW